MRKVNIPIVIIEKIAAKDDFFNSMFFMRGCLTQLLNKLLNNIYFVQSMVDLFHLRVELGIFVTASWND